MQKSKSPQTLDFVGFFISFYLKSLIPAEEKGFELLSQLCGNQYAKARGKIGHPNFHPRQYISKNFGLNVNLLSFMH